MNKQSGSIQIIIVTVLSVALAGALGFIAWQSMSKKPADSSQLGSNQANRSKDANVAKDDIVKPVLTPEQDTRDTGTITGNAIYPSEGYPADYKVCVLNSSTKAEIVCDNSMAGKSGGSMSYKVSITPGAYLVQAKTDALSGYYDGYMQGDTMYKAGVDLCDAKYHTPLQVTVAAGQDVTGINAGNFYYTPENCK